MIKWNDSDEGRDSTCQTCADHVVQCPNCDGEQWKKSDDGSSWRGCLDCELYFDEAFLKQFHSESAEWEEWKVKNEFQSSSMEDAIKKYKDLPKDTLAKEMGYENHEQWENDIKKMERSIKKTELKNKCLNKVDT
mgnify:CR=1 FL=1